VGEVTKHPAAREGQITAPARLNTSHDLSKFCCGKPALDDWLRNHALNSEGRTARTYVVCENRVSVIGYYCIATGSVERGSLPSRLKSHGLPKQIPVAILGRLARDIRFRGVGLGPDLLRDALTRIIAASETIGIRCVLVHAIDEEAAAFYKRYQFVECPIGSRTFFLAIETAIDAL
jgi:ribosomal protein S18 acetylase RimI-like enzyme